MKILYDYQTLWLQSYGGISRYFYKLYVGIQKKFPEVIIDMPVKSSKNVYFKDVLKYKEYEAHIGRILNELETIKSILLHRLHNDDYDLVHMTFFVPMIWPLFVNWRKTKLVITVHDMAHERYLSHLRRQIRLKKKYIYRADAIIAISEATKHDLLKIYPDVDQNKIKVIYHGCDIKKTAKVRKLEYEYFLYIGMRNSYKNFRLLLEAYADFAKRNSYNIPKLVCAGGGRFDETEVEWIENLEITNEVIQISFQDDELFSLYENAIAFIYPSLLEGFGIPLLEAFKCGVPIIASDIECFREIAGDAALFFESDNYASLSSALQDIYTNKAHCEKLINKGKQRVTLFTWDSTICKTYECYLGVIENG